MKTCYCRQSFRRQPQSSNWQRCKRCEPEKELNRERKCVWAGNTHTGVSVLPGESSHVILELILFGILKISKVRLCSGGTRFFPNEHIPCLSRRVLGLSSPTFWVCIWLFRQQLIIIKQVGLSLGAVEARWQRIWHTSWSASHFGKLVRGTSLGSMIKPVVGSRKGHMCGGVGKERRGDLDRPVANSRPPHLPFSPSGPLWSVGYVEFLSAWIIFVFQEEAL